jgi:hypothetical protein
MNRPLQLNGSAPSAPGAYEADDPIAEGKRRCEAFGDQVGKNCMEIKPSESLLEGARLFARSEAERIARPRSEQTDELDRDQLKQLNDRRDSLGRAEERLLNANVEVRKCEAALAALAPLGMYPMVSPAFRWTAVAGLTLSLAPAVHDLLPGIVDPLLVWILAIGFAGAVGALVILGILPDSPEERTKK